MKPVALAAFVGRRIDTGACSVSNIPHAFAVQSFVAELAKVAGRDPKDMLLELLGPPRVFDPRKSDGRPSTPITVSRSRPSRSIPGGCAASSSSSPTRPSGARSCRLGTVRGSPGTAASTAMSPPSSRSQSTRRGSSRYRASTPRLTAASRSIRSGSIHRSKAPPGWD